MTKGGGTSDAETIRILRRQLAEARGLLRSQHKLEAKYQRLQEENKILKEMLKPIEQRDALLRIAGESSVRSPSHGSPMKTTADHTMSPISIDHSSPETRKLDISKFVEINGERYLYQSRELIPLSERLSRLASKPRFMHPTGASEAKVEPLTRSDYLKKGGGNKKEQLLDDGSPLDVDDDDTPWSTPWHVIPTSPPDNEATPDNEAISENQPAPEGEQEVGHQLPGIPIRNMVGKSLLARGLRLFQESLRAAARAYWPKLWEEVREDADLLKCGKREMWYNLNAIGGTQELKRICPYDPDGLRGFLFCSIHPIRNIIAHSLQEYLPSAAVVDDHLEEIQKVLLVMGDGPRAHKARALRDELKAEAEAQVILLERKTGWSEIAFDEPEEEEWDPAFPEPPAWYDILVDTPDGDVTRKELPEAAKKLYQEHGFDGRLSTKWPWNGRPYYY